MATKGKGAKTSYHHGDLRVSLMHGALALIKKEGVETLSLRKLAQHVGVSQTAIYHHFSDKQALLCALGEDGIAQLSARFTAIATDDLDKALTELVDAYVGFALQQPELYELMFGRSTWKLPHAREFHKRARGGFRRYGEMVAEMQKQKRLPPDVNPLRIAQVGWATLHGICRMHIDGLVFTRNDVKEISHYALQLIKRAIGITA